jgi:hypothetical protein
MPGTLARPPLRLALAALLLAALPLALHPLAAQPAHEAPAAGRGVIHFPTSGAPPAQERFLEGVLALHNFMYDDARDAFREAQRLDPGFAMAYWGEAMTWDHPLWEEHERDSGRVALQRLAVTPSERLAKARTPREQAWMRAVDLLYFGPEDAPARDAAYAAAMRAIHEADPGDDEGALFYALALLGQHAMGDADRGDATEAGRLAERILARNPSHPGAAHLVIHAYDHPAHARRALAAARAYAKLAPEAHHALHMPSHIFVQLGMWDDVVASNEAAYAASVAWAARRGLPAIRRDHHSLSWLQYGYLQQGRLAKAREALDSAEAAARTGVARRGDPAVLLRAQYALETRQRTPLALPAAVVEAGGAVCGRRAPGIQPLAIYAAGVVAARNGVSSTAEAAWDCLRAMAGAADFAAMHGELRRAALQVEALLAQIDRRDEEAIALMERAAAAEDAVVPFGPTVWLPSRELYGELLLAIGRPRDAVRQFDLQLERTPNRAASLLGRARAARLARDERTAEKSYAQLAEQWKSADPELPELAEVRKEVEGK